MERSEEVYLIKTLEKEIANNIKDRVVVFSKENPELGYSVSTLLTMISSSIFANMIIQDFAITKFLDDKFDFFEKYDDLISSLRNELGTGVKLYLKILKDNHVDKEIATLKLVKENE